MTRAPWRSPVTTCGSPTSPTGPSPASTSTPTEVVDRSSTSAAARTRSPRDPPGSGWPTAGDNTIQRIDTDDRRPRATRSTSATVRTAWPWTTTSVWVANGRRRHGAADRRRAPGSTMSAPIRVGSGPRGIVRAGDDVWVANELSQSVTRIDVATRHPHPIDVGDGPTAVAVLGGSTSGWPRSTPATWLRIDRESPTKRSRSTSAPPCTAWRSPTVTSGSPPAPSPRPAISVGTLARRGGRASWARSYGGDRPRPRLRRLEPTRPMRIVYDGLLALPLLERRPAGPRPRPRDLGARAHRRRTGPTSSTCGAGSGTRPVPRSWPPTSSAGCTAPCTGPRAARPDFYAGIVGGQACIARTGRRCDLSDGVVADDAAGRVTFHLVAPDPQFLYKLIAVRRPDAATGHPLGQLDVTAARHRAVPDRARSDEDTGFDAGPQPLRSSQWSVPAQPAGFLDDDHLAVKVRQRGRGGGGRGAGPSGPRRASPQRGDGARSDEASSSSDLRVTVPSPAPRRPRRSGTDVPGPQLVAIPPFDNLQARRAFNFALDRNEGRSSCARARHVLKPTCQLMPPTHAVVPPLLPLHDGPAGR